MTHWPPNVPPTKNMRAILRTVARAYGWQVLTDQGEHPSDTYLLADHPPRRIEVLWAASGGVLMAWGKNGSQLWRSDHPSAKAECFLRALALKTEEFSPLPTTDDDLILTSTLRLLLPDTPPTQMRWYDRPEGRGHQLRLAPRLTSWDKATHPDQVRLRAYLDDTEQLLAPLRINGPWALRLDVGLPPERDLLTMADLDNFAFPLAYRLQNSGLVSVWCTKRHGEKSFVRIEAAQEVAQPSADVLVAGTTASSSSLAFKEQIYTAVVHAAERPPGRSSSNSPSPLVLAGIG